MLRTAANQCIWLFGTFMGVAEDFQAFRRQYLIPADVAGTISYRYRRITAQLNWDFWNTDSETAHSIYSGSYGRDTAARGISDLDVVFQLPVSLFQQYDGYSTNGQSALLQAVKRSIDKTYPSSGSFGDGQVVVIPFNDGITFEVLPGFALTGGGYRYPNANGGGKWFDCDPQSERNAINSRNANSNSNLKELCRMVRVWRDYVDAPMSGMLIDTLAYQFVETWEYRYKSFLYYDFMCRDFFGFVARQSQSQTYWKAPGSGSYVWRKGVFEHKARSAELRCLEAIAYQSENKEWSSRQKWREVFGSQYPG